MSTAVQRRRGTTAQHAAFVGALGETTYDTDLNRPVVHDGVTPGGFPAAMLHLPNIFSRGQTVNATDPLLLDLQKASISRAVINNGGFMQLTRQEPDVSQSGIDIRKRGTTGNSLAALSNGSGIGEIEVNGWDGAAYGLAGHLRFFATQAWAPGAHGSKLFFSTTPIGSAVAATHATLSSTEFEVMSRLLLPNTTSATLGGVYFGGNRAFHNFGTNNTFAGVNSGNFTLTGAGNSFFGTSAGLANTTGNYNSFFGRSAGTANTTGTQNSFFGFVAGQANTTGSHNSFFGRNAGQANTTGSYNSFFGRNAGLVNTTGSNNSFFGLSAGQANTTGILNSFIGRYAGLANTTGSSNTFFGSNAGLVNTTGSYNSFFGNTAGAANTTGGNNIFSGRGSGSANTTGNNNSLFGFQAGNNLTTGSNNLVMGYDIDSPTATNSNTLTIGNLIFGTGVDGTGTTISSGLVGIKVVNPVTELHVVSTSASDPRGIMSAQHTADAVGARIHFRKSRGTATAPTTVVTGDVLGRLRFSGYDSANYLQMGSIDVVSVGTIAATRVPTYMAFSTATNVAPSVLTEGFRLTELQTLLMATGKALAMASGANQRAGNAVLVGGTVTVANTSVTANTIVMLTRKTSGGTIGLAITYTVSAATSFTITSDSAIDTSTFSYLLVEVP